MAVGWAGDGAVDKQISDSIEDAVNRARRELPQGASLAECEECGEPIGEKRRQALPGVRLCLECQKEKETAAKKSSDLYNRRGSKDSQLR
ncbi:MAG: DksA/TraR family C4-type zinc finger protein [Deltaproteobacteria bacterium]|jgi:phage/conjugal plasmid C-4 type zinc finger TraR family protein|nr:DksA/TraR family C4-type zinc finger protein [Deltaproteobacteria bacterium]